MPPKGKTNNPKGRPKGISNKVTTGVKVAIQKILDGYIDESAEVNFATDFNEMESGERVKVAIKLMEFVVPKLQRTTIEDHTEHKKKLDEVIEKLL